MLDMLSAAAAQGAAPAWTGFLPIVGMVAIFWFLIIRPQMRQQKIHRDKIAAVKKGDQVVTGGGKVGKVTKLIDDNFVEVEIAPNVRVKVVKSTLADIIAPGGAPAND
ncbi:MAG: preprotein translocase subunit YajC [Porphyrobacter sp.]|nr:preprotein translocase subunit YajC [Porphyrobacter sp.]